jgi:XTP/dITP diphosphohydrolase
MHFNFVTSNAGKINSLKREFEKYEIEIFQVFLDMPEIRSSDVKEITESKIRYAFEEIHEPVIVSDAGFYIHSINGFPRAFVNFALETIGVEGILELVEGKNRYCEFRECLAYFDDILIEPVYFLGNVKGSLSHVSKGVMQSHLWSELSLIFIPEDSAKTLAEMEYSEYLNWRKISRERTSPARLFAEWFLESRSMV